MLGCLGQQNRTMLEFQETGYTTFVGWERGSGGKCPGRDQADIAAFPE